MTALRKLPPLTLILILAAAALPAGERVTSPKEQFGFEIGADYELVN